MAAPNIVAVTTITGKTDTSTSISNSSGSPTTVLNNAAASNNVYKINTVLASNTSAALVTVTLLYQTAYVCKDLTIPVGSSIALLGKDTPIYMEENTSLTAYSDTASGVDIITSYEIITD